MNGMAAELDRTEQKQLAFFRMHPMSFGPPYVHLRLCPEIQCNVFPDHAQAAAVILSETDEG